MPCPCTRFGTRLDILACAYDALACAMQPEQRSCAATARAHRRAGLARLNTAGAEQQAAGAPVHLTIPSSAGSAPAATSACSRSSTPASSCRVRGGRQLTPLQAWVCPYPSYSPAARAGSGRSWPELTAYVVSVTTRRGIRPAQSRRADGRRGLQPVSEDQPAGSFCAPHTGAWANGLPQRSCAGAAPRGSAGKSRGMHATSRRTFVRTCESAVSLGQGTHPPGESLIVRGRAAGRRVRARRRAVR